MSTTHAIELAGVGRVYRTARRWRRRAGPDVVALRSVDLTVPVGEVHGILGPNGAGKSTLCKILATVLTPTAGTARILGHDVVRETGAVRPLLALVLGGERGLYYRLTARQNLLFWGALYGLADRAARQRTEALLSRVGLAARADDRVETFSRGMKQRVHLARGLLSDPRVMLLDEPTTGMDPVATRDFHELIEEVREDRTILLTTHDMVEAESLCDRVTLIGDGQVVATESPATLAGWITRFERVDVTGADDVLLDRLRGLDGVGTVTRAADGAVRVETVAAGASERVLRFLLDSGHTGVRTSLPSLEEVYVRLFADRTEVRLG